MKKFLFTMVTLLMTAVSSQAMSFEQARQQALFLADKMAYELNLTEDQYEAVYEVNLDYLMGVTGEADLYGDYWTRRNLDMSYILYDWQYRAFLDASYFYRPLYWADGFWHFGIYGRYPHRDYFYFGRPDFWGSYHGGHSWGHNGGRSWYNGRDFGGRNEGRGMNPQSSRGMRDDFNNGNFGRGTNMNPNGGMSQSGNMGRGQSSTRTTVGNRGAGNGQGFNGNQPSQGNRTVGGSTRFGGNNNYTNQRSNATRSNGTMQRSNMGTMQRNSGATMQRSNMGTMQRSSGSTMQRSNMGTMQRSSGSTMQRSSAGSSSRSFSGGPSHSSGSSMGGATRSAGGGSHSSGGGSHGGRR